MGPLLFILYADDTTNTTSLLETISFADDTIFLFSHPDISSKIDLINKKLNEISNKLSVNASKTHHMIIGTSHISNKYIDVSEHCHDDGKYSTANIACQIKERTREQKKNSVILDDMSSKRFNSTKFLGIIIDESLTLKKSY